MELDFQTETFPGRENQGERNLELPTLAYAHTQVAQRCQHQMHMREMSVCIVYNNC